MQNKNQKVLEVLFKLYNSIIILIQFLKHLTICCYDITFKIINLQTYTPILKSK